MTNDPDIRAAKSIVDYIFRWMGKRHFGRDYDYERRAIIADAEPFPD
jgi:hypothetical protein